MKTCAAGSAAIVTLLAVAAACMTSPSSPGGQGAWSAMRPPPSVQACYPDDLSGAALDELAARTGLLPAVAAATGGVERFFSTDPVWSGAAGLGSPGQAGRISLTYSFPGDGVSWDGHPNDLNAALAGPAMFGPADLDRGRELFRQGLAAWRRTAGITYGEVADDNTARSSETVPAPLRGDIRFGGTPAGTPNYLAYDYFPGNGADMVINTSYFIPANLANPADDYRYLRNLITHEHGHGLGFTHSVPCDNTKLMEPLLNTGFEGPAVDEVRAAQRQYGDRFAGNHWPAAAHDFGSLTSPAARSVIEQDLSTNGAGGPGATGEDWFRFTVQSPQTVAITVVPTGGAYTEGPQANQCFTITPTWVDALRGGRLLVELRDAAGTTIIASAPLGDAGVPVVLPGLSLLGNYTLRIADQGPNAPVNQVVQLYDLTIRVGAAKAPPQACAGINKRIAAGAICFFMGNITSRTTEVGATITTYAWDLDGDGVFEIANNPQPTRTYSASGVYPVTLRVTDSNGMAATDTILVTVFGGGAACWIDWDHDGTIAPGDIAAYVNSWFLCLQNGSNGADLDGDLVITPADVAMYVGRWFGALSGGC